MNDTTDDFFGFQHKEVEVEKPEEKEPDIPEVEDTEEEEKEDEDTTEEDKPEVETEEEEKTDGISFVPFLEELTENGVLLFDPEKEYEDSEEGFQEVIKDTVAAKLKQELDAIPEDFRSILEHMKAGGSLQEWVDRMDPTDFANADLEDEDTQEILVREQLKVQGFTEAQIEKKVTKFKDQALLDSEAEDAKEYLVEKQKKDRLSYEDEIKQQAEAQQKAREKADASLLTDINALDELENIKLTKELKTELHKHLTVKGKDGLTTFQRNLNTKEGLLAAALRDMKGIGKAHEQRKATTQATGKIRKAMEKYVPTKTTSGKAVSTNIENNKKIPMDGMPWS